MKFQLTPEQAAARKEFRSVARATVAPNASEFDREEFVPRSLLDSLAAKGLLASFLPAEHGGRDLDMIAYGLLHEELGRACSSVRSLITVHDMVAEVVHRLGNEDQQSTWLQQLAAGKVLGAFALSEPTVGSDASAVETAATPCGGGYELTGRKKWVTSGQSADVFLVVAKVDGERVPSAFLVPRETPGVATSPMTGLLGLRGAMLAEIEFRDCRLPADARIGPTAIAAGLATATALSIGRYGVAWGCVGIGQAAMEASFEHSRQREQFGVRLDKHQLIRRLLTDMAVDVRAARLLCLQAGYLAEARDPGAVQATLMAKYFGARMASRVAGDAVQVHGAIGCSAEEPIERLFRDARVMEIIEGTTEIQQLMIASHGYGDSLWPAGAPTPPTHAEEQ